MLESGFLVTTVRRGTPYSGSGFVFWIDSNLKKTRKLIEVPSPIYPEIDINKAFGGKRGFRGIRKWDNHIVVATFDKLLIFDMDWNIIDEFSHQFFSDIHGIEVSIEGIWVTSTGNDAVFLIDWNGKIKNQIFLSEIPTLVKKTRHIPKHCDYRRKVLTKMCLHPNYVSIINDKIHICCRKPGLIAIFDINVNIVQWDQRIEKLNLPHDAKFRIDRGFQVCEVSETGTGSLITIYLSHGKTISATKISLAKFGNMSPNRPPSRNRTNWLRGLLSMGDNSYLVGQAPARVLYVKENKVNKVIQLDEYPDSAVFDITSF